MQDMRRGFNPWVRNIPWRRKLQPTPVSGESHGQRSLVGYRPWGCKESDTTEWTSLSVYIRDLTSLTSSGWSGGRGDRGELFSIFYSYDNI